MKQSILKRLADIEKRVIPKDVDALVFVEKGNESGTYTIQENVYHGGKNQLKDTVKKWTVSAHSAKEAAKLYVPPEGCKEPIIFIYDFGEGEHETQEQETKRA